MSSPAQGKASWACWPPSGEDPPTPLKSPFQAWRCLVSPCAQLRWLRVMGWVGVGGCSSAGMAGSRRLLRPLQHSCLPGAETQAAQSWSRLPRGRPCTQLASVTEAGSPGDTTASSLGLACPWKMQVLRVLQRSQAGATTRIWVFECHLDTLPLERLNDEALRAQPVMPSCEQAWEGRGGCWVTAAPGL